MGSVIGIIPARWGSSRFPGKPLALIDGKTLIQRTFESASAAPSLSKIVVATDDQRIFDHVIEFGGDVVMTSEGCLNGTERLAEAAQALEGDIFVNIQGDWPCIDPEVVEAVIGPLKANGEAVMGTAVTPIQDPKRLTSHSLVKCVVDQQGRALYFSRAPLPKAHAHLGIYSYRRDFLLGFAKLEPTPLQLAEDLEQLKALEHGFPIEVAVVDCEIVSVDRPEDIKKVEDYLWKKRPVTSS